MFERLHHQRIHEVLMTLDAALLRQHACYFGGGTAIVLQRGEYRESLDMDFMVSDLEQYRALRRALQDNDTLARLFGLGRGPLLALPELRSDQYGIRTRLPLKPSPIKFEIVFEARIAFDATALQSQIAGVTTLNEVDLVATKLLANADRWLDDSTFSRDIIDLAMLRPHPENLTAGFNKAYDAYGDTVQKALAEARERLMQAPNRLARCIEALKISTPQALLYQNIARLAKIPAPGTK